LAAVREALDWVVKAFASPAVRLESPSVETHFVDPNESALQLDHLVEQDLEAHSVVYHVLSKGLLRESVSTLEREVQVPLDYDV